MIIPSTTVTRSSTRLGRNQIGVILHTDESVSRPVKVANGNGLNKSNTKDKPRLDRANQVQINNQKGKQTSSQEIAEFREGNVQYRMSVDAIEVTEYSDQEMDSEDEEGMDTSMAEGSELDDTTDSVKIHPLMDEDRQRQIEEIDNEMTAKLTEL